MEMLRSMISFLFVINIVVFVHEFGHYFMAKKNGIDVLEFALGMGPAIFSFEKNGTLYALRIVPIGGYVRMEGEDEDSDQEGSFSNKKPWQRFLVLVAGAFNNILLCLLIFMGIAFYTGATTLTIDTIIPGSPLEKIEVVQPGDQIIKINDQKVRLFEEAATEISTSEADVKIEFLRDGEPYVVDLQPIEENGTKMIGFTPVVTKNVGKVIIYSFSKTRYIMGEMYKFLGRLFTGKESTAGLSGPVGIAGAVGDAAALGFLPLVHFMAFISLNLGVMNLLPFPALDGGRLVFILIEMITGKAVPPEKEGFVHVVGFVLLIALIIFVSYQDIMRLITS